MAFFARDVYTAIAAQTDFTISFPYISNTHVELFVDGTELDQDSDADTGSFQIIAGTTARIGAGLAGGETVVVRRSTSQSARLVDYASASTLTEEDLDNDSLQAFYLVQEAIDAAATALGLNSSDLWDATSKRIVNLADPTSDQDAASKAYVDSVVTALGNVPPAANPGDDGKILVASAGSWSWTNADASTIIQAGTITATEIGANQVNGTHIAMGGDAQGDILYYNGTNYVALAAGTSGQFLQTQGAGANPQWAAAGGSSGEVAQVQVSVASVSTGITANINYDNSIPQNTEGTELTTVTITPTAADSTILIEFGCGVVSTSTNGIFALMAVFVDSEANALTAIAAEGDSSQHTRTMSGAVTHAPGDTSAHTYKLRGGEHTGGTAYFGQTSAGGALFSTAGPHAWIKVTEILA